MMTYQGWRAARLPLATFFHAFGVLAPCVLRSCGAAKTQITRSLRWCSRTKFEILSRDFRNYATGKFHEAPPGQSFHWSIVAPQISGERQYGWQTLKLS